MNKLILVIITFIISGLFIAASVSAQVEIDTDVCPNIPEIQSEVPLGYTLVEGQCIEDETEIVDLCENIPEIQEVVPPGYGVDGNYCYPIEVDGIPGCMDPSALNYNPQATIDNQTCEYPEPRDNPDSDDDDDDDDDDSDDDDDDSDDDSDEDEGLVLGESTMKVVRLPNTSSR